MGVVESEVFEVNTSDDDSVTYPLRNLIEAYHCVGILGSGKKNFKKDDFLTKSSSFALQSNNGIIFEWTKIRLLCT